MDVGARHSFALKEDATRCSWGDTQGLSWLCSHPAWWCWGWGLQLFAPDPTLPLVQHPCPLRLLPRADLALNEQGAGSV